MNYFDMNRSLSTEDKLIRDGAHKFAEEVMRPIAKELDSMSAKEGAAPDSPVNVFLRQAYELGYHKAAFPEELGGLGFTPLQMHIFLEELAWGSFGLASLMMVASFPYLAAAMTGDPKIIETFTMPFLNCSDGSIRGCWGAIEPTLGSDIIGFGEPFHAESKAKGDCRARLDGDEYVINGQKAAWVSGATLATHSMVHLSIDGDKGFNGWGGCIVPLDLPGVSKGLPLEKIGQRDLNQGELYFDDVRIPKEWVIVDTKAHPDFLVMLLTHGNMHMAAQATGLARAAFEHALEYTKERVQGGKPLCEHYSMKQRLMYLFSRVEMCRSMSRAVVNLNMVDHPGHVEYSIAAKLQCTQAAFDNANEAIQIFGGNGLTKEYPVEKLFRDARATFVEDGLNEVLARRGGHEIVNTFPKA